MTMSNATVVDGTAAVLVDAETVPRFVGSGGLDPVLEETAGTVRIVVRRAYGRWFGPELREAQNRLARLGFELIHTFAPLPTNRPSTVQLVVDALELAGRSDRPSWIVLVSAECDLAPLARRLQQLGPRVMVVGPRGVADRTVRACCDKLVLFDRPPATQAAGDDTARKPHAGPRRADPTTTPSASRLQAPRPSPTSTTSTSTTSSVPATSEAHDLARRLLAEAGGALDCLRLRMTLVQSPPGFDEAALGFGDFLAFVRADRGLALEMTDAGWRVRLTAPPVESGSTCQVADLPADASPEREAPPLAASPPAPAAFRDQPPSTSAPRSASVQVGSPFYEAAPSREVYAGLLRKLGWDFAQADAVRMVVAACPEDGLGTERAGMVAQLRARLAGAVDERALRRALSALCKSACLVREGEAPESGRWRVLPGLTTDDALLRIDQAMVTRLRSMCESYRVAWHPETARALQLADHSPATSAELPYPVEASSAA